jgi:hypothetical protein
MFSTPVPFKGFHFWNTINIRSNGISSWEPSTRSTTEGGPIVSLTRGRATGLSVRPSRCCLRVVTILFPRSRVCVAMIIRFKRTFGLPETVEWDNLCRIFDLYPSSAGEDEVLWALEASGEYSTNSMYRKLSAGRGVTLWSHPKSKSSFGS